MLSNTKLSPRDFEISFQIKMAMHMLSCESCENTLAAKENLTAALNFIHRE